MDSLRQRFGRLNRIGQHKESEARIIATKEEITKKSNDPIYGNASAKTWVYLKKIADKSKKIDFGIKYFKEPQSDALAEMLSPSPESVTLLPSYVQFWSQTNPRPWPDPEPALFLHGIKSKVSDVQIVWRNDATCKKLNGVFKEPEISIPPSSLETISVPVWVVKKWLIKEEELYDFSDLEKDHRDSETNIEELSQDPLYVIRWRGTRNKDTVCIRSNDISPGDTIIIPTSCGGCDQYGWDEKCTQKVKDLSIQSNLIQRRRFAINFDEETIKSIALKDPQKVWDKTKKVIQTNPDESLSIKKLFEELKEIDGFPTTWITVITELIAKDRNERNIIIKKNIKDTQIIFCAYRRKISKKVCKKILLDLFPKEILEVEEQDFESITEDSYGGENSKIILLDDHSKGVEKKASEFCSKTQMTPNVKQDIILVAKLHDYGKAEPRVQGFLRRIDPDELSEDEQSIAKSQYYTKSREEYKKYINMAHLPDHYRHECWSVSIAKNHPDFVHANDPDLVLYLIGTHHGYGRPLFPPVIDKHMNAVKISIDNLVLDMNIDDIPNGLDSNWIDMCERLYEKYGPWNLAYMESVIRLADHRQSEEEANVVN